MRSAVIIYNPAAGRFSVRSFIKSVVDELKSAGWNVDAEETKSGDHTIELAKQASAEKKDAVFAVGGDGTIGNVVNGVIGSETALGVLPAGTANVWNKELGLDVFSLFHPGALRKNASALAKAPTHSIDVGMCNGHSFMMWAGIGLDALVIQASEPRKRVEKFFPEVDYAARAVSRGAQWTGVDLRLWADDVEVDGRYIIAVSTNIRHYLGGYSNLSPDAYLDDGLLDLWLFSGNNFGDALRHAYNMWRGRHIRAKDARRIPFSRLRVEGRSQFMLHTDAEPRGSTMHAEIEVRTRALKLLVPPRGMDLLKYK